MTYVADPADPSLPTDGMAASGGAAELRALKGYLQGLIGDGTNFTGYAWQGFRNRLINGNFQEWQRGTNLAAAVMQQYLADMWFVNSSGTTVAPSRQSFTLGQTAVPYEPTFFHRCVVASVAGAGNNANLQHRIEDVRTLAGQKATLSFWAKADSNKNIAIEINQNFGGGGSPSAPVNGIGVTTIPLTSSWQYFTVQADIPSIAGKTLGTDGKDGLFLYFWMDAGSNFNARTNNLGQQSGTFDIAQVQLEPGGSATPFEIIPPGLNLALCQRYYQVVPTVSLRAAAVSGQALIVRQSLPVVLRAAPSVTFTAGDGSGHAVGASLNDVQVTAFPNAVGSISATNIRLNSSL